MRQTVSDRQHRAGKRGRNHRRNGAAVGEQVGILLGGEQRVDGYGNDAGANRAPKRNGIVDRVVENENDTVFLTQSQVAKCRGEAEGSIPQIAVGQGTAAIGESNLVAETAIDVGVDEIGCRVVGPAVQELVEHRFAQSSRPSDRRVSAGSASRDP